MRLRCRATALALIALLIALGCRNAAPPAGSPVQLVFDSRVRFQTILGWGGLVANWHSGGASGPTTPMPDDLERQMLRELVYDLGLNLFGLELAPVLIEPTNDNDDPFVVDPAGFDFSKFEPYVRETLLPLRDLVEARGERFVFYVSVTLYQPKPGGTPRFVIENPDEYIEFCLVSLDFFRRFGLEPDYWILVNEPDLVRVWTPNQYAQLVVRLGQRLRRAGYRTLISAPATVHPASAPLWLATVANTPGARPYLGMISYHSYDYDPTVGQRPPIASRLGVANWSRQLSLPAAQTEQGQAGKRNAATRWDGSRYEFALDIAENIFADLLYANAGVWQLHAVMGWGSLPSFKLAGTFLTARQDGIGFDTPEHYWAMRHFARFVRPGAVRVALFPASARTPVRAVGFLSPQGTPVVVVMNAAQAPLQLQFSNLPAGTYRMSLTTRKQKTEEQALAPLASGETLGISLPPESVATLWQQ